MYAVKFQIHRILCETAASAVLWTEVHAQYAQGTCFFGTLVILCSY